MNCAFCFEIRIPPVFTGFRTNHTGKPVGIKNPAPRAPRAPFLRCPRPAAEVPPSRRWRRARGCCGATHPSHVPPIPRPPPPQRPIRQPQHPPLRLDSPCLLSLARRRRAAALLPLPAAATARRVGGVQSGEGDGVVGPPAVPPAVPRLTAALRRAGVRRPFAPSFYCDFSGLQFWRQTRNFVSMRNSGANVNRSPATNSFSFDANDKGHTTNRSRQR
jgi:hypothetical protein